MRILLCTVLDKLKNLIGLIDTRKRENITSELMAKLQIDTQDQTKTVDKLSGGNQQKVVIARWLATQPRLLIMNDPTRGIDVGTKEEIYTLMNKLVSDGMPIVLTSSEIDEVIGLSDRILIMYKGKVVFSCGRGESTKEELLHYVNMGEAI
ncbi:MAG: sugar ABC transporter ATP-binding protein [Chloroflexia bacterium]|nr:sugar ABC transporter ATP-binding protein [Chloroflexia bacterium]